MKRPRKLWTAEEDAIMRAHYPHKPTPEVAAMLPGRSTHQVYGRAWILGLGKTAEYLASDAACRIQRGRTNPAMVATQFPKGHKPWNVGKRGWQAGGRSAETQFKKGELSGRAAALLKPVGALRTSYGNLERKVTDGGPYPAARWKPVHRLVWEAANGPVPAGHIVVFKPGRRTVVEDEITLDRLECITRRENMERNSRHNRYPPELNQLMQLKGALNRKINNRSKA